MSFEEILDQALAMLQRRGRVSYRALQRQFALDDTYLEDVKAELLYAYPQVSDDGRGLVWTESSEGAPTLGSGPLSCQAASSRADSEAVSDTGGAGAVVTRCPRLSHCWASQPLQS